MNSDWESFFNSSIGSSEITYFIEEDLVLKLCIHPGIDDKTLVFDVNQDYANLPIDTGFALTIEGAVQLISILEGFIASRGVQCNSCGILMNTSYIDDDRGDFCYKCAQNDQD